MSNISTAENTVGSYYPLPWTAVPLCHTELESPKQALYLYRLNTKVIQKVLYRGSLVTQVGYLPLSSTAWMQPLHLLISIAAQYTETHSPYPAVSSIEASPPPAH